MAKLQSINPSNYQVLGEIEITTAAEIKDKVAAAHKARKVWKNTELEQRIELLRKVSKEFAKHKQEIATLEAQEMGMPINDALFDVDDSLNFLNWYLEHASEHLQPETTFEDEKVKHWVVREPIGVTAAILPWNFPFANIIWGTMQSLIVGNVVVMKHSEECPLTSRLLNSLIVKHLPVGVFDTVYGDGKVGDILTDQDIDLITFTGSTRTGKYLYEKAGKKFIRALMELGGSAPGIVFADADLEIVTTNVCTNRLFNSGQCCDGLKRLIVHESIMQEVVSKLKIEFENKKLGDAEDPETNLGPLVSKKQLAILNAQVQNALTKGAKVITGGKDLEQKLGGAFFAPTILTNVTMEMQVATEEVFGPVLPIFTFQSDEEALKLANETSYGLGAYVYTRDNSRIKRFAAELETGMVSFNGNSYIKPFNPFGGYKASGLGREHGEYGFHELTQIKVIAQDK